MSLFNQNPKHSFRSGLRALLVLVMLISLQSISVAHEQPSAKNSSDTTTPSSGIALAITGAKIVTAPGKVIENGTIIVRNGMIEAVGAGIEIPYDATEMDAKGMVIYAGFIDSSTNKGLPTGDEGEKESGSGEDRGEIDLATQIVAATREVNRKGIFPDYSSTRNIKIEPDDAKAWRNAGFTTIHVMPSGDLLNGTSTLVNLVNPKTTATRDSILQSDFAIAGGWRAGRGGYPSSLMGVVAHLRQNFLDAQHYQVSWEVFNRVKTGMKKPPFDPAMESMGKILKGELPVIFPASNLDDVYRARSLAEEFGFDLILNGLQFGFEFPEELADSKESIILNVNFPKKPELGKNMAPAATFGGFGRRGGRGGGDEEIDKRIPVAKGVLEDQMKQWEDQVKNPATLAENGVGFILSPSGNSDMEKFYENLRLAIEHGLSVDDALASLTIRPARFFGVQDQLGTVEKGKMANLVAMTGNLEDKESKVKFTLVDGEVFENRSDDEKSENAGGRRGRGGGRRGRGRGNAAPDQDQEQSTESKDKSDPDEKKDEKTDGEEKEDDEEKEDEKIKEIDWQVETDDSRIPKTKTNGNVLIQNATVITAINGTLNDTSILIRDGIIAQVGQDIAAPEGFTVIDGNGAWVMPGIIDCHSHMVAGGNEGTLSVTPEVRAIDNMRSGDLTLYRAAAGGVTAANILHGSANTIGGQRIVIQMKYKAKPRDLLFKNFKPGIKFALGENVIRNENRYPNTRMGVESVLRLAFEEAIRYKQSWQKFNKLSDEEKSRTIPPRRDLRLEALQQVLDGELLVHCHCYNAGEILMLLKTFTRFGIENLTLEHGLEAFKVAPEIVSFGKNGAYLSTFADFWGYKVEAYDAVPYNVAVLQRAGGTPILNSDSGERVRRLNHDAAKMVRWGGLTYQEAIQTITLNPAKSLQIDDVVGSIEVGKKADIAIFNGHPLNTHSRCFLTLIDGEIVFERGGERGGPFPLEEKTGFAASMPEINSNGVYVIKNAAVFPGSSPKITNGTVVIKDGKIAAVGGPETAAPQGATIVDGSNLEVHPGMIDGGSTVAVSDLGLSDAGEQGEIKPILKASSALKPDSPLIGIARFTGMTSSVTTPTGGLISGQSAIVQLDGWNFDELAFVDSLALEMALPSKKIGETSSGGGRRGFRRPQPQEETEDKPKPDLSPYDQIKKLFAETREYDRIKTKANERGDNPPEFNEKLESMIPFARKEKPVVVRVRTAIEILDALEFAKDIDINLILRDSGTESWKVADKLKEAGVPILIGVITAGVRDSYDPYDVVYSLPAKLHEAGVLFAFHTSSSTSARDLPLSAGIAVGYGLPKEVAIAAMTSNTAKIFGIEDQVGTLQVGKRADIVITDRSPLQATSNVIHMFINGKPVDVDDNKHTDLYKKYMKRIKSDSTSPESGSK